MLGWHGRGGSSGRLGFGVPGVPRLYVASTRGSPRFRAPLSSRWGCLGFFTRFVAPVAFVEGTRRRVAASAYPCRPPARPAHPGRGHGVLAERGVGMAEPWWSASLCNCLSVARFPWAARRARLLDLRRLWCRSALGQRPSAPLLRHGRGARLRRAVGLPGLPAHGRGGAPDPPSAETIF